MNEAKAIIPLVLRKQDLTISAQTVNKVDLPKYWDREFINERIGLIENNSQMANHMQDTLSFSPNPACERCQGFGRIHPLGYNNKPDYSRLVMCEEPGCLSESFNHKGI